MVQDAKATKFRVVVQACHTCGFPGFSCWLTPESYPAFDLYGLVRGSRGLLEISKRLHRVFIEEHTPGEPIQILRSVIEHNGDSGAGFDPRPKVNGKLVLATAEVPPKKQTLTIEQIDRRMFSLMKGLPVYF